MYEKLGIIKRIFDNTTILMIILAGIFVLLIDGRNFKDNKFMREYRVVQFISYSYIVIGVIMWIALKII